MVLLAFLAGICAVWTGFAARAATTERVVVNRFSGLAIEGFDPVAYFVDRHPVLGLPEYEAAEAGAIWRFRNEGNRASFVAHPDIYGPQFGGYDPTDVARGVTFAGNPRFWVISRRAALSVRAGSQPRRLCRRPRAVSAPGSYALARAGAFAVGLSSPIPVIASEVKNPDCLRGYSLDCFVALALLAMTRVRTRPDRPRQ